MYIAHTVPGRYPLYPWNLVLYLEEGISNQYAPRVSGITFISQSNTLKENKWPKQDSNIPTRLLMPTGDEPKS